jgi:hypothetical protein
MRQRFEFDGRNAPAFRNDYEKGGIVEVWDTVLGDVFYPLRKRLAVLEKVA